MSAEALGGAVEAGSWCSWAPTAFGVISIWVIIWGGRDVLRLLRELRSAAREEDPIQGESAE